MSDFEADLPPYPHSLVGRLQGLKASGKPITLSISGLGELSVRDGPSFELLLDLVDRLDEIEAVREGMKAFEEGKGISLEEAKEAIRRNHEIPL